MSVTLGRRPVFILSTLICAISSIWRARATSYNSFMGASVLNGIAAGPCETLQPQIIVDVMFLHDRGKYQTLYFSMYFASLMIGPIIAGAMASNTGWRSFWWLNTGLLVACLLWNIFLFPETRYHRSHNPDKVVGVSNDASTVVSDKYGVAAEERSNVEIPVEGTELATAVTHVDPWLGRGSPSKAQFKLFQSYEGNLIRELWVPWYLHLFPIVEFAAFVVSWTASGYLVVNLSQVQVFAAPPYNYTPQTIGLFNLAVLVGAIIGLFTCGPFSDWIAAYLTKRNGGVREPEMRLAAMIPYVLIMIIGSTVTAVGYDYKWPWQVIVIIGWGCLGIQVAALPAIASTYAIDSYKPVTSSLFVAITVNKNLWGYGVGYVTTSKSSN